MIVTSDIFFNTCISKLCKIALTRKYHYECHGVRTITKVIKRTYNVMGLKYSLLYEGNVVQTGFLWLILQYIFHNKRKKKNLNHINIFNAFICHDPRQFFVINNSLLFLFPNYYYRLCFFVVRWMVLQKCLKQLCTSLGTTNIDWYVNNWRLMILVD